jgi:acyl carrier protein
MDSIEQALRREWCEVLGVAQVDEDDEFFSSGGDSKAAVALIQRVRRHGDIEFPLDVIFINGTFAGILSACRELNSGGGAGAQ